MAIKSLEHRFELPQIIAPQNIEHLRLLPLHVICRTDIDWPLDTNEVAVTEPVCAVEVESDITNFGMFFAILRTTTWTD